ncbi:hypothetical protein KIM67_10625, partial [Flagellimonas sp. 389]|uniref:MSCRAMM family adhesin SdrC n=1 Tax=Flagellimonas sp. 389 TaxID=2835862 RepID=UPI001BD527E7
MNTRKNKFYSFLGLLVLCLVLNNTKAYTQTKGLIYKTAGVNENVLDPNLDGYTSSNASGFFANDESESEIPYTPLPSVGASEPDSDLGPGPSCGFTDLVKSDNNNTIYTYLDASDNLMFRFRLGGTANNSKGYSILIDTDNKFGKSGPNADPNYLPGNPGFEIEVVLRTNFGVGLYNVDGTLSAIEIGDATLDRPYADFAQKSIALSEICGDNDYFYDFFIPFADITTAFPGVTTTTPLRMVGGTVINPKESIGNSGVSDIGGIDDNIGITDNLWEELIDVFPPTSADDIGTGTTLPPRAECPSINGPIGIGETSISGTSSEVDGATIEIFRDGVSNGTTTVTSGNWSITGLTATAANEVFTASASVSAAVAISTGTSEKSASYTDCNTTTVGATCSSTISPTTTFTVSNKGLCGDIGSAIAGAEIKVYFEGNLLTPNSGSSNFSGGQVFANPDGSWFWKCNTNGGGCTSGPNCGFATDGFYEITQIESGSCESDPVEYCAGTASISAVPIISNLPILDTNTIISGTATADASITIFIDDVEQSNVTATGGNWSFTVASLPNGTLNEGETIVIESLESGNCSSSTTTTVGGQSDTPIIQGEYCSSTGSISSISGISSESGATINLYTSSTSPVAIGSSVASTTVNSNGSWTISATVAVGDFMVVTASNTGESESMISNEVEVFDQTSDPDLSITSTPIREGDASISGRGTPGNTVFLYLDGFIVDETSFFAVVDGAGDWTISGLDQASAGFDVLYADAVTGVTVRNGALCESGIVSGATIDCKLPLDQTFSATTPSTVCEGETVTIEIDGTEDLIVYELIDQNGVGIGPAFLGDGGPLTLTTFPLSNTVSTVTSIAVKGQKIGVTCETVFGPAISITVSSTPTVSLTTTNIPACFGETTVDLNYSIDTNGPAIDYSIDFDVAANTAGFLDITDNTSVTSPIVIPIPGSITDGVYNGSFTVRNSNSLICTSEPIPFTITVTLFDITNVSATAPTICAASDGSFTIEGLENNAIYETLDYEDDGVLVNHGTFTTDGSGNYTVTGIDAGTYTNFEVTLNGCTATFAGPITLSDPGGASIAVSGSTNSTDCVSPNGEIGLTGMPDATYDVNFSYNGAPQATQSHTAVGNTINITGLNDGDYTAISITDAGSCKSNTIGGPITISNSFRPTITLGTFPSISQGVTTADLSYSATTGSPNQYTLDYDTAANTEGFIDISTPTTLPATPIVLTVPSGATVGTYNGILNVINSSNTCISNAVPFTITVTAPVDSDGDGINDDTDTSPSDPCLPAQAAGYTGYDSTSATWAAADCDGDNETNGDEHTAGTDPYNADSDGDGINDDTDSSPSDPCLPAQAAGYTGYDSTSATWAAADCDGDNETNGDEDTAGTDPYNADSDGDGI